MYQIRRQKIKDYIYSKGIATIKELQALCPEVTFMTLHRDLDTLQGAGYVVKIRGGARAASQSLDPSFHIRMGENPVGKERIAKKAIKLVKPGSSVFFDAGTTNLALIRALSDFGMTIFTSGANFAGELARLSLPSVNVCCGALNRANMARSGQSTLTYLADVNIDVGFIGVSGYSDDSGFTCGKESEKLVKKLVIDSARASVMLMDVSKLAKVMPFTFAGLEDVDYVICDETPPLEFLMEAERAGTTVL
ncbi:MAG: DeoR/GlpR family DNA-binding transcription regulator [Clostridiales bacterium]|jgi:DeoR/GlpR family transcriptional regulator of sugar metabolism|nr:DeoR/GlpR family DNA-binding transcription regulator [Clostridiales bacterium]